MRKPTFVTMFLLVCGMSFVPDSDVSVVTDGGTPEIYSELRIPEAPHELVATSFGPESILLQWRDNSDREIAFDIHFVDETGKQGLRFVDPNVTRHVLSGLKPSTKYEIRIRARGPYGHSEFTPYVHLKTGADKNFMVAFD